MASGHAEGMPAGALSGTPAAWVTPEAVGLDLDVATVGSRGVALLLDLLLLGATLLVLAVAVGAADTMLGVTGILPPALAVALALLAVFALLFGYPICFEVLRRGRTPGKAALGLRVVTVEGAPVALRHAVIRALFSVVELYATVGVVAVVSSIASSRAQRLGDLTAGTLVVRERRASGTPEVAVFAAPAGLEPYVAVLDVSGVRPEEYTLVRDALRRMPTLPPVAREEIAATIAARLVVRVRPAPHPQLRAEDYLRCVAAAVQRGRVPTGPGPSSGG